MTPVGMMISRVIQDGIAGTIMGIITIKVIDRPLKLYYRYILYYWFERQIFTKFSLGIGTELLTTRMMME